MPARVPTGPIFLDFDHVPGLHLETGLGHLNPVEVGPGHAQAQLGPVAQIPEHHRFPVLPAGYRLDLHPEVFPVGCIAIDGRGVASIGRGARLMGGIGQNLRPPSRSVLVLGFIPGPA